MELLINGKTLSEWTAADLAAIIGNSDYRESEYIDYKLCFAFNEAKGDERQKKVAEFKHDVCSLANAGGGYLFFGIQETGAIPTEIVGIDVPNANTDKSEQDLRNKLTGIQPAIPTVTIRHILIAENRFVIVARVHEGVHVPYVYKESESLYKFFMRRGNGKKEMSYNEIRNAFMYSLSLNEAIRRFRDSRQSLHLERLGENKRVILFHIMPEDMVTSVSHRKLYVMMKEDNYRFSSDFNALHSLPCYPNIDGLFYSKPEHRSGMEVQFFNNGAAELIIDADERVGIFAKLHSEINETIIYAPSIFFRISEFICCFAKARKRLSFCTRFYACFSIFGCSGCLSEYNQGWENHGRVDRNAIVGAPFAIHDITDESCVAKAVESLKTDFALSLGVRDLSIMDLPNY